ncbi:ribonucleoside-diphosphate reductase subunit alpha [Marinobacter salarius]|uniref:ribonucleoside-diphosphate reductase subunit alpha n=1 Tax=Marinobacter salarius TaxID=1420917 RepID=UPI0010AB4AF6|nr:MULTISPECIES: ribonucleoside-diphosphate reductase subunit alpha [Marinobacter]MBJ7300310.1 ribonucleoside-diphosphate reductase subunit alpha [Marinobacter salarius]HIO28371.1 ribonucleoside-diphosphate reductase subunit alpha [Marinobacter salarius]HIP01209.1 ribonucleoside-diphosphate reductase subunit alpha [Marinobacter salarius]
MSTATLAEPGQSASTSTASLQVIKRNGALVGFDASKISVAVTKAFLAVEGDEAAGSARIHDSVEQVTHQVMQAISRRLKAGGKVHIEDIQDQVELALMRAEEQKVARAYVLYREAHAQERASLAPVEAHPTLTVKKANGEVAPLDLGLMKVQVERASQELEGIDGESLVEGALRNLYDGIAEEEVLSALIMTARGRIEQEPDYSAVTARLLLEQLRLETAAALSLPLSLPLAEIYPQALSTFIEQGIHYELLDDAMAAFDLERLGAALKPERDHQFGFLGLQTLYDRYFLNWKGDRLELPQVFFMRVSMGLALQEDDPNARAIEFYDLLSSFDYMASTPTLFNSGTRHSQLSSCYLTTVQDDLEGIYGAIRDNAMLSKWAGGLGNDWTPVRALGSHIKGTNGSSQGVVPFLKVVNDTAVAVNQGGKRKGAVCAYLESWHLDIEEFLELRKNTGDERRRTHDMNTASWVPDLLIERMRSDQDWTLFSPNDTPDLHDLYGNAFRARYQEYEAMAARGEITLFNTVSAKQLWRKMLTVLFETGHPWITFKDPCNLRSPQQHRGVVHSSNLCTEITLNTSADEIAVCNLGSINLAAHVHNGELDVQRLERTVNTAVRMLDNVVDINYYAVPQAKSSNFKHRPVGLGLMGFQDALYRLNLPYTSAEAVEFADVAMEQISYFAIRASAALAGERGAYETYEGSLWHQGILPIDSINLLKEARQDGDLSLNTSSRLDWTAVRELIARNGMRNSNVMAIAPTATISNIVGVSQSIEPAYQNLFVKSNLSGEFTVVNPSLVRDLKAEGLWDNVMVNDLKYFDGSVQQIDRIPAALKARYATAFEIDARWLVEAAARRQKWLDQAQSLNLYMAEPSGKKLDELYQLAWERGLKTTYYLRSLGATGAEKTAPVAAPQPQVCSIDEPDCEACQ